ncbi:hypothetical protein K438DRAFT_1777152 [Mycena galopus ATCC 62051]|nr:hypothetical protein K438DRAFT_1777152 [Mycena galopus ATCC 62051]
MLRRSNKTKGGRQAKAPKCAGKTVKAVHNGQQGSAASNLQSTSQLPDSSIQRMEFTAQALGTGSNAELTPLPESRADSHSTGSKRSLKNTKNSNVQISEKDKSRPRTRAQTKKHEPRIHQESSGSESDWVRAEKIAGKRRRDSAESIESAEMRIAAARSLKDMAEHQHESEVER